MKQHRRLLSLLLVALLFSCTHANAVGITGIENLPGNNVTVVLKIKNGNVTGTATAQVQSDCTAYVSLCLQHNISGVWTCIAHDDAIAQAGAYVTAVSGRQYRAYAYVTVKDANGMVVDTLEGYSTVKIG